MLKLSISAKYIILYYSKKDSNMHFYNKLPTKSSHEFEGDYEVEQSRTKLKTF